MIKIIRGNWNLRLDEIINPFIPDLKKEEYKNKQKIIELCHVAKFLDILDSESCIKGVSESPDFIIQNKKELIGVELKRFIDIEKREYEGFFETIFLNVEQKLKEENSIPNLLVNCWLHPNINYSLHQKKNYVQLIVHILKEYVRTGVVFQNILIRDIKIMPHKKISLYPNFGIWVQQYLSNERLQAFIKQKEQHLLAKYKLKWSHELWLLVIIGGTNASSFKINWLESYHVDTKFDRVYILEDFYNNLYQLK